jgi:hypothetical protein
VARPRVRRRGRQRLARDPRGLPHPPRRLERGRSSYDYRDLGATVDRQGTRTLSGSYAARDVDPSSLTVHDDATGATYPATVNADNTVDLTLDGLRYHFTAAQ